MRDVATTVVSGRTPGTAESPTVGAAVADGTPPAWPAPPGAAGAAPITRVESAAGGVATSGDGKSIGVATTTNAVRTSAMKNFLSIYLFDGT